jgi:hypothetical protein
VTNHRFDPHPGKFDTVQDACNYAYIQLLRQGKPSMTTLESLGQEPACAYRGDGGAKCFVGHLWPDETYDENLEGTSFPKVPGAPCFVVNTAREKYQDRQKLLFDHIGSTISEDLVKFRQIVFDFQMAHDCTQAFGKRTWSDSFKANCEPLFSRMGWPVPRLNLQPQLSE